MIQDVRQRFTENLRTGGRHDRSPSAIEDIRRPHLGKRDHRQPCRHRFEQHQTLRLGPRGKGKDIGRRITARQGVVAIEVADETHPTRQPELTGTGLQIGTGRSATGCPGGMPCLARKAGPSPRAKRVVGMPVGSTCSGVVTPYDSRRARIAFDGTTTASSALH